MSIYARFVEHWRNRRHEFAHVGALVDPTRLIDDMLAGIEKIEESDSESIVTLKEASRRTGYSVDHLARLIRQGKIQNTGRRFAPRIRVSDLPVRRSFARNPNKGYSVDADARTLRAGRQ